VISKEVGVGVTHTVALGVDHIPTLHTPDQGQGLGPTQDQDQDHIHLHHQDQDQDLLQYKEEEDPPAFWIKEE